MQIDPLTQEPGVSSFNFMGPLLCPIGKRLSANFQHSLYSGHTSTPGFRQSQRVGVDLQPYHTTLFLTQMKWKKNPNLVTTCEQRTLQNWNAFTRMAFMCGEGASVYIYTYRKLCSFVLASASAVLFCEEFFFFMQSPYFCTKTAFFSSSKVVMPIYMQLKVPVPSTILDPPLWLEREKMGFHRSRHLINCPNTIFTHINTGCASREETFYALNTVCGVNAVVLRNARGTQTWLVTDAESSGADS